LAVLGLQYVFGSEPATAGRAENIYTFAVRLRVSEAKRIPVGGIYVRMGIHFIISSFTPSRSSHPKVKSKVSSLISHTKTSTFLPSTKNNSNNNPRLTTSTIFMYLTLTKLPFPICHTLAVPNISSFCSSIPPATESPLPYHFTLISRPAFKRVDLTCLSPSISIPGRLPIHSTFQPLHSPYVAFLSKSTLPLCYFPTNINITLVFLSCQHQHYPLAFHVS
jgi:hypothetical protein